MIAPKGKNRFTQSLRRSMLNIDQFLNLSTYIFWVILFIVIKGISIFRPLTYSLISLITL